MEKLILLITKIGVDPQDNKEQRLQKNLLVFSSLMMSTLAVVWGVIYLALHEDVAAAIPLSYSALSYLSIASYAVRPHYKLFRASQLLLSLLLPFFLMLALGGFVNSSAVILWSITSPLGALLFVGRRQAIGWFLSYLVLVTIGALLEPFSHKTNLSPQMTTIFFLLNIGCTSIVIFVLLQYFVSQKDSTLQLLHIGYEKLAEKNQELIESHQRADRIFSALAEALPGTILDDKYQLNEKIGAGGFGAVYRATHLAMKRPIAVKVFKPTPGNDSAEGLERFQLEAVSASKVVHPNAVTVLDSGISSEGIAYLVMELLSGRSLKDELKEKETLSLSRAAAILIPVCDVISKAHSLGILHRDIKPDNIFLSQTEEGEIVKVVDFGIAKFADDNKSDDIKNLTATGKIIGTPVYIAPERFDGKPYDGKSDVYSIGVVLYEMLTGKLPYSMGVLGAVGLIVAISTSEVPPLRKFKPDIPKEVEDVVLKAISKDPANRPTAKELATEFVKAAKIDDEVLLSIKGGSPQVSALEANTMEMDHNQILKAKGEQQTNESIDDNSSTKIVSK